MKFTFLFIFVSLLIIYTDLSAQKKFFTRSGKVVFFSKAPLENIKAVNKNVSCIYDTKGNKIVSKVLIKAFEFDKTLMQKHFNENYLESDKYPKASFKGKINHADKLDFERNWDKTLEFEGDLTIHGVTKEVKSPFEISLKNGVMTINCTFFIRLKDYEIEIPSTVISNISENVKITVNFKMNELKN